ncbi:MAG TPA: hypothetical protein VMP01_16810 [Pirellulaceae bacterium]|nr:hypothetical protein [Pirellulaceae bacterium]
MSRNRDGSSEEERLSKRAAGILAMTNVDRKQSIKNSVKNIDIRRSGPALEPGPLVGYYTAQSLTGYRRPETVEAILDTLEQPRTSLEILIRACVLNGLDHPPVIMARVQKTLKAAEAAPDKPHWADNLRQLRKCLAPDYFRDRANWPSRLPDKIHPPLFGERRADTLDPPIERFPPEKIDIADATHMYFYGQLCRSVEIHCAVALLDWHDRKSIDQELALTAARLLNLIAIKDSASALCATMTLREPVEGEPKDPLDGFPAAQALAASGRTDVADELIRRLRGPYPPSDREVLLGAHILRKLDRPEIMLVRLKNAPASGALQKIESWFKTPGFFDDPANWPSRLPQK